MMIEPYSALKLSVIVGVACVILGLPLALLCGWVLARKEFWGKTLLTMVVFLPLSLPPVVTGLLILSYMGRETLIGQFFNSLNLPITFSLTGAIVSSYIVGFPLYVMMIRSAFESVDRRYEEVARTLGLSPLNIFLKISLPLALPGISAGMVITFARAMGEFGATSIVAGNIEGETRTISLALYSLFEMRDGLDASQMLMILSIVISFLSIAAYEYFIRLQKKRLEVHE
jgi:molybdate transport system permease protein